MSLTFCVKRQKDPLTECLHILTESRVTTFLFFIFATNWHSVPDYRYILFLNSEGTNPAACCCYCNARSLPTMRLHILKRYQLMFQCSLIHETLFLDLLQQLNDLSFSLQSFHCRLSNSIRSFFVIHKCEDCVFTIDITNISR